MKQQDFLLFDIAVAIKEPCRVVCGNNNYVIKDMYVSSQNILSENEVFRVQQQLLFQQSLPRLKFCKACGEQIPQARVDFLGGCLYCKECQEKRETVIKRVKMIQKML